MIAPGLRVLFCGINPGLWSGATGLHFARPGNRFWPALHASGFTDRLLRPHEQEKLLEYGLGITNLVGRASARAQELADRELREGGRVLEQTVHDYRPEWVAIVGITAYRKAFGERGAVVGPQGRGIAGAHVWALPNPRWPTSSPGCDAPRSERRCLRCREAMIRSSGRLRVPGVLRVPGDR
ncbi:hypothetical protein GCM10027563_28580 [Parasphingorhabdus pacifica]